MLTKEIIEKKYPGKKLEELKILNFYGNDFSNIDIISQMKSLNIISLSSNKISSLKPFKNLPNLQELILRNNNIENIDEIDFLKTCNKLNSLWLEENPVCKKEEYKQHLINTLPNLKKLDNSNIIEIKEEIGKNNKQEINKNITYNEDKLEDLLLDYEKENDIEEKKDNNDKDINDKKEEDNKNNLLGSKSDIFKSDFIKKEKTNIFNKEDENNKNDNEKPTTENTENTTEIIDNNININKNDDNNKLSESNKESKTSLGFSKIKMSNIISNEPNNDLLNDILRNVDTSQSIIQKKSNSNKQLNINKNNLTKNLDDLINEAKLETDNNINNINNNIIEPNTNETEINKILNEVSTSQTILNKKEKDKDNKLIDIDININNINNIDNKNINNVKSIEDIKKLFKEEYKPNNKISSSDLYRNNNIRDTQINNIFKNEMITSESFTRNSSYRYNGPYKPDLNIPNNIQNYNNNNYNFGYNNKNRERKYNIKPSHENKIRAITNLLEDLNLENLLIVKKHIVDKLNGQK